MAWEPARRDAGMGSLQPLILINFILMKRRQSGQATLNSSIIYETQRFGYFAHSRAVRRVKPATGNPATTKSGRSNTSTGTSGL